MIRTLAVAATVLCLASFTARAEDFVVIESSVPATPAGATVKSDTMLTVPDKGRLVLVAASGQVRTINGPFHGPLPAAAGGSGSGSNDVVAVLSTLMGKADQRTAAGVVRATDVAWRKESVHSLADVVAVNATDGGDVCLYDPGHAMITHNPSRSGAMSIEPMNGGAKVTLDWPKDTVRLPWPGTLPLADGSGFLFEDSDQGGATLATVHVLPAAAGASDVARAMQMAKAGCRDQAKLLLTLIASTAK